MTTTVERRVLETLAEHLASLVQGLVQPHAVTVGSAEPSQVACYPNLVVDKRGAFVFEPFEGEEIWSTPTTVTHHIADMTGEIEVRLGFRNAAEREDIEDRIMRAFKADPLRRGVLLLPLDGFQVDGDTNLAPVGIGYGLVSASWDDEMVFESKRFSVLTVQVDMPALVTYQGVRDITTLILALTNDLASDTPTELVDVDEDGTITTTI